MMLNRDFRKPLFALCLIATQTLHACESTQNEWATAQSFDTTEIVNECANSGTFIDTLAPPSQEDINALRHECLNNNATFALDPPTVFCPDAIEAGVEIFRSFRVNYASGEQGYFKTKEFETPGFKKPGIALMTQLFKRTALMQTEGAGSITLYALLFGDQPRPIGAPTRKDYCSDDRFIIGIYYLKAKIVELCPKYP